MTKEEFESRFVNQIICGDWIDVLKTLPDGCAHCCITSPPYWGQRNYGVEGQLGLEKTVEEHIEKLVVGFREVRRVLRDDGVLWLNYGDKYSGGKRKDFDKSLISRTGIQQNAAGLSRYPAGKDGDLLGLAWRLAFALQADGWWLRSDVIWVKAVSFCETYSGSTMPESVNGWRWERHRVKIATKTRTGKVHPPPSHHPGQVPHRDGSFQNPHEAQWANCPGCPKCEPNDGLVLRKGSWRSTRAHEYLFQLCKSDKYFCDAEAVREEGLYGFTPKPGMYQRIGNAEQSPQRTNLGFCPDGAGGSRNLRDCWAIGTQAYPEAHYATFPEKLVEPCIKVSTSEKGCCPKCGAQWARIVSSKIIPTRGNSTIGPGYIGLAEHNRSATDHTPGNKDTTTLGWRPTCKCGDADYFDLSKPAVSRKETVPCVALDPFVGSGTVCAVAARLKRDYIGIELNPEYIENQAKPRIAEVEIGITVEEQKAGQGALFE